ncbi:hypothetical protein PUNSTDRAFT_139896 [Punctularia strigosozonata HHB-11173 SS5]|uniref:uncharacterized protein n=1 Tax=Punctularia strigosozonata (strain HHB-11173) TaxID=741275 RepID=UPI0004416EDF|nr:uncharacterized protein PUNSTDRAFT_139896 [Punctularia strigosozonata HHB-11173 SS5]EIN13315.1 hypothetical protein PUNSTDRAFT_139896 [Punctularia strigosozonata HHB-11173 SS5]
MFHALASEDTIRLQQLAQKFYIQTGNRPAALFSLDCICGSNPAGIQKATPSHVSAVLQFYRAYAQLLRELGAGHHVEINQPAVQQLFGYRTMEDDVFFIPSSTYLGAWIMKNSQPVLYTDDAGHRMKRVVRDARHSPFASITSPLVAKRWNHISILQLMFCRLGDRERAMYQRDWLERLYDSLFPPLPEMGSPANLSLSSIPQAKTTLPIVKEWIRESFYQVHRAPPDRILTQFMRLCSLAYEFDRAEAPTYIFRAPLLENDVPGLFLRDMKTTKASIFYDLTVRQSSSASWICLVLCLKHIVETPLSIDISILCAFIDQICTYSVVLARIGSTPPLHDVTMPYSWLVRVSKHLIELAAKQFSMSLTFILVDCMRNLLQQLSTTTMNLLFKRRPLGDYGLAVRGAFMSRVCKSMCLLGYNVRHDALRAKIVMALSSCRGNRVIPLCDEYFSARDWSGLARVIRQIPLTPLDGLVQLYHASRSVAGDPPPRNVRRVIYSAIVEIPQLLTLTTDSGTGTTLRGEAAPFVSNSESVRAMLQKIQADEQKAQGISDDKHDADDEQDLSPDEPEVDAEAIATQLSDDAPADALVEGPSDKELEYVRIVQAIYRRKLRHRQHAPDANDQARSTFYSRCLEQSRKMDWQYTHYRHLFLGPLPHVLVYLKKVQSWAENAKRRIKAKTGKSHKEYDDLFDRQTLMNNYRKTAQRLQDALRPEAAFHLQRDSEQLKALVKEVEALAKSLPANSTSLVEVEDDLAIAVKGIVTPPKPPPAKPEKPDVQIDDAYDLYNEAHGRYDED